MTQTVQLGGALIALLLALPLISHGTTTNNNLFWWAGLLLIVGGAAMPVYARLHCGDSCSEKSPRRLWGRLLHRSAGPVNR
jgi:hypothetical protein